MRNESSDTQLNESESNISAALSSIIKDELQETLGCTDPSAVGLASAAAVDAFLQSNPVSFSEAASEKLQSIKDIQAVSVQLDFNLFKNASAVWIPGTGEKGIPTAAAFGILIHKTEKKLRIFDDLTPKIIEQAKELLAHIPVEVEVNKEFDNLSMIVKIFWKSGDTSSSRIAGHHDTITWTAVNDHRRKLKNTVPEYSEAENHLPAIPLNDLEWIVKQIEYIPQLELSLLRKGLFLNVSASDSALSAENKSSDVRSYEKIYGLPRSLTADDCLDELIKGKCPAQQDETVIRDAKIRVAAATRSRMQGEKVPIMACGGSGNHGITFFITLYQAWQMRGIIPRRSLLHGAALGVLLLHEIKKQTGVLTPMCGCAVSSGLAASAAVVWGMGGGTENMLQAMNIVLGSIGGIVCDGAKPACALKTSLSAQTAIESARMAMDGLTVPADEGLGAASFSELLNTIKRIHIEGMAQFDETMVSIIQQKD
ncbi:MAG: L-serine ammonia-lyase, iron-sulfur-dependent, subunit alpha [Spirochaetia bacterium]|nr:L-serine ammonia-lyase, iron-sulfur-dependent, subunit alpha [Spirochaetia bacterium]MCF7946792.1 L-serine ammonia-lyase, iron-sulfur-dependent, subunit alpha [Spirochaetia bacterium]MCF7952690.1 L-serine ammonia-lyase, iron-sulfur-dependent, subunit alpha [Spirochaetales bacterium]